ncbi:MAG: ATP-dependent zinc metalloprotease FtsH [bacterium]
MGRNFRNIAFYLLLFLIPIMLSSYFQGRNQEIQQINYSQFSAHLENGDIESVTIVQEASGTNTITGTLKDKTQFRTIILEDPAIVAALRDKNVTVEVETPPAPSVLMQIFTTAFPILLVVGAFFFLMQQTQSGGNRVMTFGKSRARLHVEQKKKITFADVAGIDEAKEEVTEIVDFLKHPKKYIEIGARIPKGVLLFGPPGTGKTLLARAIAGEAGVPFFSISGSDFVEMFVGVGASRVRDLFDQAKKNAPCIVFIDEIDAVGRQRGAGYGGGHDEREQTLNQLLVEMDGFGINEGIIVVAATNRHDVLDPALLRPGRFDRRIILDRPDVSGRLEILRVHVKGKPLSEAVDLEVLARRTAGFTGADLANIINEGALLAARLNLRRIGMEQLEESIDRVMAGPERKSRSISEKEKKIVAHHEAAHALVAKLLKNTDPVHKVSIIPRGAALGYVLQLPIEDRYLVTKSEILDKITTLLAGRAAEDLIFQEVSTGAQNDLEQASKLVRKMICEYGMSDELGPVTLGSKQEQVFLGRDIVRERNYSEEIASAIDRETRHLVETQYEYAKTLLTENIAKLEKIAQVLIERETIEGKELEELLTEIDDEAGA